MDILETISRRISIRNYLPEPASASELEEIRLSGLVTEALTDAELYFHLCSERQIGGAVGGIFGNYGRIIRAQHYIVLTVKERKGYLVDSGFRFEQMILEATRRNLGTCWIGGMFKEASIRNALGLDASWRVIAITPIGKIAGQSLVSSAMKAVIRSSTRKPIMDVFFWNTHGQSLPENILSRPALLRVFEATRWAPSWANKQPWRFILGERTILVYKLANQIREGKDYHLVDCGIAMAHLHLAAKSQGIKGRWRLESFEVPGASGAEAIGQYSLEESVW